MFPGQGNAGRCAVMLYVGEGPRGSSGTCSTLHQISVTPSATHNQIGPLWCWFLSGWACARPRPLWFSPTTSPVRLGVSPAAAPTPTGVFTQRSEALFPLHWSPGIRGLLRSSPFLPIYVWVSVGLWGATHRSACPVLRHSESGPLSLSAQIWGCRGLLVVRLPDPFVPHSASLGPTTATGVLSVGCHLRPSYRSG